MSPVPQDIRRALVDVLSAEPSVRWACLFGSAARGERFADLDVGVVLSDPGAVAFGRIANALQQAVPGHTVDLVELTSLAPAVAGRVARERVLLVDNAPEERAEWEVEANRRALDIEPWLREFERLRLEALGERLKADG